MCLRNYDSCVTKWVCPSEGIIHVLRLELFRIKHIPFPLEKDTLETLGHIVVFIMVLKSLNK